MFDKKITCGLLAILGMCLAACASPQMLTQKEPYAGQDKFVMLGNELKGVTYNGEKIGNLALNIERIVQTKGKETYDFQVVWHREGGPFININPGESLTLIIDDNRKTFRSLYGSAPNETHTEGLISPVYTEWAVYENIPRAVIQKVANAHQVRVELATEGGHIVAAYFTKDNFDTFQRFLDGTLPAGPAAE